MQTNSSTSITDWRRRSFGLALALLAIISNAEACELHPEIAGKVDRVVDGDTLTVAGVRIRLRGLDAPELKHRGGNEAREALRLIVGKSPLACRPDGTVTHDRIVATCFAGEMDIAAELIRQGRALDCARFSGGAYASFETAEARTTQMRASYCRVRG